MGNRHCIRGHFWRAAGRRGHFWGALGGRPAVAFRSLSTTGRLVRENDPKNVRDQAGQQGHHPGKKNPGSELWPVQHQKQNGHGNTARSDHPAFADFGTPRSQRLQLGIARNVERRVHRPIQRPEQRNHNRSSEQPEPESAARRGRGFFEVTHRGEFRRIVAKRKFQTSASPGSNETGRRGLAGVGAALRPSFITY